MGTMPEACPPRILVVEDDRTLALAVEVGLHAGGYEVRHVADGHGFVALVEQFHPDLALLDVSLPEGPTGFDLARMFRSRTDAPLMFITASDALEDRLSGFGAGADDYIVKPFALAELLARVRAVLRRAGRLASGSVEVRDLVIDEQHRTVTRAGQLVTLRPMEFELLTTLARAPGRVFSKSQLLSLVWGFDEYDPNLVEVHVSSLRRKIETAGPPLIHTERGRGYVLRP
jgi:two-component system OmpR family response regulator